MSPKLAIGFLLKPKSIQMTTTLQNRQSLEGIVVKVCFVLLVIAISTLLASPALSQGFTVSGSTIRDPQGATFIPLGANVGGEKYSWGRQTASAAEFHAIKNVWKLNAIRTNHYAIRTTNKSGSPLYSGSSLADVVSMYTPHKIVVMEELHDFTGSLFETMSSSDEQKLKDYWRAKAVEYKNNPYVWFNLINEPGGSTNSAAFYDKWVSLHRQLISIIRGEGANNIIVVDGMWFGQDAGNSFDSDNILDSESAILSRGLDILSGNSNIVFSVHTYAQWGGGTESRLANYIDRVKTKGMAILIGESGAATSSTDKWKNGARYGFAVAKQKGIGIFAWHWQPGDDFNLTSGGDGWGKSVNSETNPTNLTVYGQALWDLTHATSSCTSPAAPGALSLSVASSSTINLSWADYSSIEDGYKIERKQGSGGSYAEVGTVGPNVTTFQSNGLSPSTTYYYRVRGYQGTCNSGYSAEKNATTQASSNPVNLLVNPGFETGSLSPWSGTQVYISSTKRSGSHGVRLGSSGGAAATLQQTVTGLKANTTYVIRGYLRVASSGITVQLGVDGYGGSKTATAVGSTSYSQSSITFTTGSSNTSARIFLSKPSTSTTLAYADDFELLEQAGTSSLSTFTNDMMVLNDTEANVLSVQSYPNPVTGIANVLIRSPYSGSHEITIYDQRGRDLFLETVFVEPSVALPLTIDLTDYKPGLYILRISHSAGSSFTKIMKKN